MSLRIANVRTGQEQFTNRNIEQLSYLAGKKLGPSRINKIHVLSGHSVLTPAGFLRRQRGKQAEEMNANTSRVVGKSSTPSQFVTEQERIANYKH
eukprot:scaffold26199_cov215-Cylindrotheca_fusiformis.AAC.2